jgi:hypothetical protein
MTRSQMEDPGLWDLRLRWTGLISEIWGFHGGLNHLLLSLSEWVGNYEFCRQLIQLLGRVMSPSQGCYFHRSTQTQNTDIHPCL